MKNERINRLFLLGVIVALCWGTTVSAKGRPYAIAKLQKKYQITPIQLQEFGSDTFRSDIYYWALQTADNQFGVADMKGKIIIPCTPCYGIYLVEYSTPKGSPFDYNLERDGWGFVMQGDKYSALFDEKGKEIIPFSSGYTDIFLRVDENGVKYINAWKDGKVEKILCK